MTQLGHFSMVCNLDSKAGAGFEGGTRNGRRGGVASRASRRGLVTESAQLFVPPKKRRAYQKTKMGICPIFVLILTLMIQVCKV